MLLIPCPWCGSRNDAEFRGGGEAHIRRPEPDATGYRGFYYHFLDMRTGRRVWQCELSTIDSAFLFAGMLTCAAYFDADSEEAIA